ncbi:MAG: sulfatase-like hydrolase/transferase [Planctomycetota bacterium]
MRAPALISHVATLLLLLVACCAPAIADKPNIVVITMDDMNWDSMGAYGNTLADITPHMDQMAAEGLRFQHAYVVSPSCVPSRNALMTGRFSHTNGVMGFYNVESGHYATLPESLRAQGYFTAVVHKPRDTSLHDDYETFWDYHVIIPADDKRNAPKFGEQIDRFIAAAAAHDGPFFCVINIPDPHKPFYGDQNQDTGGSFVAPSHEYTVDDVEVPAFLPDLPKIREEVRNYYNSVKRGDDCFGAVVASLKQAGVYDNSVVMFLSDHGMPLPYAKGSLYREGLRTPWVVRWPGTAEAGAVVPEAMISGVDLMPTLLEIAGASIPDGVEGRSFLPLIKGESQDGRDAVFAQFNENAGGLLFPSRSVQTPRFNYIFNAWSDGSTEFKTASTWHASYGAMRRGAERNEELRQRFDHWRFRTVEELYDYDKDPHGHVNVIDDPAYAEVARQMRDRLEAQLRATDDYALEALLNRDDPQFLASWMQERDAEALHRAQTLQWKRYKNREGGTGKRTERFVPAVGR